MKTIAITTLLFIVGQTAGFSQAGEPARGATAERMTTEEFLRNRPALRADPTPIEPSAEQEESQPTPTARGYSLEETSTFIQMGGVYTIIPKNAVIQLPDEFKTHVVTNPSGTYQPWASFFPANRSWIHVHEVTLEQARGLVEIDEKTRESLSLRRGLIIATLYRSPVSVNTPQKQGIEELTTIVKP